jgi:hypothetical protein
MRKRHASDGGRMVRSFGERVLRVLGAPLMWFDMRVVVATNQ